MLRFSAAKAQYLQALQGSKLRRVLRGITPLGKMRNGTFYCLYGRHKPQNLYSVMMEK